MSKIDDVFARQFATEWIAAWNGHDQPRALSHYRDDFTMSSPRIVDIAGEPSGRLHGKPAVAAYWARALSLIPDLRFGLLTTLVGADSVALYYRNNRGRLAVEVCQFDADGLVTAATAHYA